MVRETLKDLAFDYELVRLALARCEKTALRRPPEQVVHTLQTRRDIPSFEFLARKVHLYVGRRTVSVSPGTSEPHPSERSRVLTYQDDFFVIVVKLRFLCICSNRKHLCRGEQHSVSDVPLHHIISICLSIRLRRDLQRSVVAPLWNDCSRLFHRRRPRRECLRKDCRIEMRQEGQSTRYYNEVKSFCAGARRCARVESLTSLLARDRSEGRAFSSA